MPSHRSHLPLELYVTNLGEIAMTTCARLVVLAGFVFVGAGWLVMADSPVALFRTIEVTPEGVTKFDQDTRQLFRSTVDVTAIAQMPESITI